MTNTYDVDHGLSQDAPGPLEPVEVAKAATVVPDAAGDAQTAAARDVLAERQRQVSAEGWTAEKDDTYAGHELADAAAQYVLLAGGWKHLDVWPWARSWLKPTTPRRNLVKAGALILAEIERLDRAAIEAQRKGGA